MSPLLQEALSLALRLNPQERLQLIEQVASSVENELETPPVEKHWGKSLLRLLDELGSIELDHPEIQDPIEWVKTIRQEQAMKHDITWDTES